ncbi:MAG TPA: hypothetical protein VMT62_16070 [Syntrophorhabdaceae bacterium]|nr:hypothetical protein [Syntrophorhabdaceae bacterium]
MNFRSLYVWFLLPVLIIIAWVVLVYVPVNSSARSKEGKLTAIRNERQTVERDMKDLVSEASSQKSLQVSYDEFMSQAPAIDRMPEYMKNVTRSARDRGMAVVSLSGYYSSLDVSQKGGLVNPTFEMGLKGGFLEMGRFLEELSNKPAFKGIEAARIGYDEKEYPQVTGRFVIDFKALTGRKGESK